MKSLILKSQDIYTSMRMDGSYHLSDAVVYEKTITQREYILLRSYCSRIFTAGRNKRVYTTKEYGYPYLSNSDVILQDPFSNCKYNSKKYGFDNKAILKEGMIVTGRVGAIGQTAYITKEFEEKQAMGSDNIIRLISKDKGISGFLYAYLTSKIGNTFLWKYATGGVQPYINEEMVGSIPIPIFPTEMQQQIHGLIDKSSKLRIESNKQFEEIVNQIEKKYTISSKEKYYSVNIKNLLLGDKFTKESRIEADFYQPQTEQLINDIKKQDWAFLGDITNEIERSGLRERRFVKVGMPLVTGQNLNLNRLNDLKMLSLKFTKNIEKNTSKESDILISVFGTIGKIEYAYKNIYQGVFASEQLIKIKVKPEVIHPGYVYAFLKSKLGQIQLQKYKTGSVIEWIIENNVASIVVPIPCDKGLAIGNIIDKLTLMRQEAYNYETTAIQLIETEIAQWQQ